MSTDKKRILVVDDEPDILQLLDISLTRMGFSVYKAESLGAAKYQLSKYSFHLCLTDFKLPDGLGSDLVGYVQENYPQMPIAVITAFGTINHAVDTLKRGAYDFITKPISLETLRNLVIAGLQINQPQKNDQQQHLLDADVPYFNELNKSILKYAESGVPTIIYGQLGSWKEELAVLIHKNSRHHDSAITFIDCNNDEAQLIPDAGGTWVYANMEALSTEKQAQLLKQLKTLDQEPQIFVTSNWSPEEFKNSLGIKKTLLRHLVVGEIETRPLTTLNNQLAAICESRLETLAEKWQKVPCKIHPTALTKLRNYSFPGNLKELDLILSKAAINCENHLIREKDIELENTGFKPHLDGSRNLEKYIEDIEIREINNALAKTNNNKTKAAELLGISFRALRYKIKKLGIEP
ncbi:sigma-54-dependent transcriptional regulator [Marinicella gelatinilytica]|uniref:sigma-54-dependent transcriptional regulator n=1 Tax=Marinicella gelatinilytica TaxID=2996017 RepID=UPI002260C6EF|nr:response regulator [Marinicella gelatinilytica]MCX7544193.1 response regulator [Marinicella gelatinilytica]